MPKRAERTPVEEEIVEQQEGEEEEEEVMEVKAKQAKRSVTKSLKEFSTLSDSFLSKGRLQSSLVLSSSSSASAPSSSSSSSSLLSKSSSTRPGGGSGINAVEAAQRASTVYDGSRFVAGYCNSNEYHCHCSSTDWAMRVLDL